MKKHVSLLISLLLLLTAVLPAFAAADPVRAIAAHGVSDYRIVVGANALPADRTAAETLQRYLGEITGAAIPVVADDTAPTEKELVVGITNRDSFAPIDRTGFDDDAVRILTAGQRLYLTGGAARGALYAVYTFLEDWLGCRWFTHDLTVTPEQDVLTMPDIDYFYTPPIRLRQTYWMFSTMYADFCAAHKLHGIMAYLPEELGGGRYEMAVSSVHTMQQFVPQSLFETHPEYFGADDAGARSPNRQPCLRNEAVFRLAVEYAETYFAQNSAVLSVSQNDGMDFCRCDQCRAFNAAHGGADSAALLDFVNRVAAEIRRTYPAAKIETLAYQGSQKPPTGLSVGENVVIRLCAMNTCSLHALDDPACPPNAAFDADFTGWSKLTDRLYLWDYSTNFQYYYALYPNITSLQGRYRYFRDRGAIAVFDHGCGDVTVPGELHELRTYLVLKLLWDPDTDIDRHISEFCAAYYGEAAADVIAFIKYFEANVGGWNARTLKVCHNSCQDGGISLLNNASLSAKDVKTLDGMMAAAQGRSLNEDEARRLQGFALSWRFFKNALFAGEFNWFSGWTDPAVETLRLVEDLRDYGITCLSENWGLYIREEAPDARMMPTFWYTDEDALAPDVRFDMKLRVFVNRLLRILFAPLRVLTERLSAA